MRKEVKNFIAASAAMRPLIEKYVRVDFKTLYLDLPGILKLLGMKKAPAEIVGLKRLGEKHARSGKFKIVWGKLPKPPAAPKRPRAIAHHAINCNCARCVKWWGVAGVKRRLPPSPAMTAGA